MFIVSFESIIYAFSMTLFLHSSSVRKKERKKENVIQACIYIRKKKVNYVPVHKDQRKTRREFESFDKTGKNNDEYNV